MNQFPLVAELFGSERRTLALVFLGMLERSYPSQLAELTGLSLDSIQKYLLKLERDGIVVSFLEGRLRRYELNPKYLAAQELKSLLQKIGFSTPQIMRTLESQRRRPRRPGKAI